MKIRKYQLSDNVVLYSALLDSECSGIPEYQGTDDEWQQFVKALVEWAEHCKEIDKRPRFEVHKCDNGLFRVLEHVRHSDDKSHSDTD